MCQALYINALYINTLYQSPGGKHIVGSWKHFNEGTVFDGLVKIKGNKQ